jgi:O-antigen/teichoic acid export membrane protein
MLTLGKSFFLLFIAEFLFYVSGYVIHMGAGRILGVEDYGRYSLIITFTILIANLIGAGLPIAMSKYISSFRSEKKYDCIALVKKKIALWQGIFMIFLGGVFFLLAPVFARMLGDESLTFFFRLASGIIPLYGADLYYFYYYSGLKRFDIQAWLKCVRALLRVTVILALAFWFHLEGIIAGYLLVPLLVFFMAWFIDVRYMKKFTPKKEGSTKDTPFSFSKTISLASHAIVFLVLFEILVSFDMYILKYILEDDTLIGQYSASLTLARIPTFLFYALTILLLPTLSEMSVMKNIKQSKEMIAIVLKSMLIITIPFVVILSAYAESILTLLFGISFVGAKEFVPLFCLSMGLLTVLYVLGFAFIGAGKASIPVFLVSSALVVNGILSFVFIEKFGVLGALWVKLFISLGIVCGVLIAVWKVFGVLISLKESFFSLLLGGIFYGVALFFGDSLWMLCTVGLILCIVYVGILFSLGIISSKDTKIFELQT